MSSVNSLSTLMSSIRNGSLARKVSIVIPRSNYLITIVDVLYREGYILSYKQTATEIHIWLKYVSNMSAIHVMRQISKPSARVHMSAASLKSYNSGLGIYILSTSLGVMSDRQALSFGVGGEVLCSVK